MIKTNYLSTCVPTHKVIQNKNKYIANKTSPLKSLNVNENLDSTTKQSIMTLLKGHLQ